MTASILTDRPPSPILLADLHANRLQAEAEATRAWAEHMGAFRLSLKRQAKASQTRAAAKQRELKRRQVPQVTA